MVTSPNSEFSECDVSRMVTSPNSEVMSRSMVSECDVSRMRMSPSSFPSSAGLKGYRYCKGRHYCQGRKDLKVDRFDCRTKWLRSIDLNVEKIVKVETLKKIENIVEVEKLEGPKKI
jgi:hypothetical protein